MTQPSRGDASHDQESPPGMPLWAKVFGIALAVVVLLIVILLATGGHGRDHGPGQHMSSGRPGAVPSLPPTDPTPVAATGGLR